MIGELVPGSVATAWRLDDSEPVSLFPEETALVANSVERRQQEFATVRLCARLALARFGVPEGPLTPGPRGEPRWPAGITGSMTHCEGYRAAAVARAADVVSLGIDAEPAGPLPDGVLGVVSLPEERRHLAALEARKPGVSWDKLLFSAKESVFKTWYPLTGRELDFDEAVLEFTPEDGEGQAGTFDARLLVPGPTVGGAPREHFTGRWIARGGLVITAIVLTG
ncbi:Phosphopantetheinyl transferase [Streptomyces venezuelae]|uniref:4'-phosphopantetheinyl transferase family protein n=1 Tax=Streptomyces gardneri TaxID=66892 RepID=UPI0006BD2166|nr:4'-phosphopantetheinyl transferase superfamily protein [Streptomyces gardneri]ALO12831.1 Phosphopantetheinyl transferase [Streptomyces venezuelae]QPK49541.1 4'-phosphopantetheinyl transferase superfamily protein [Streptomyces gardneri]WRK41083.1 4'-phosphopantetheinyl transferase superfamily protein [Streptomyces venezuelae]CUM36513.1 4'-phosphopantetheinyl transferase entD [Streptomyces venezuelae]